MCRHTFPSKMQAKDVPSHQMIQMKVGEKFINASAEPHMAAIQVSTSKPIETHFNTICHAAILENEICAGWSS